MVSASTETTDSTNFTQNPLTETPLADDEIDEIIPIHAEANFVEDSLYVDSDVDEIIPIHAEANFVEDSLYSGSDVDEIIPIHAELNAQDEGYSDEDYYYETEILPDTLESYEEEEMVSYGSIYDSTLGDVDEIIQLLDLLIEMSMKKSLKVKKPDLLKSLTFQKMKCLNLQCL